MTLEEEVRLLVMAVGIHALSKGNDKGWNSTIREAHRNWYNSIVRDGSIRDLDLLRHYAEEAGLDLSTINKGEHNT